MNAQTIISEFQERYGADISTRRIIGKLDAAYLQVLGDIGYLEGRRTVNIANDTKVFYRSQNLVTDPNMSLEDWTETEGASVVWNSGVAEITVSASQPVSFENVLSSPLPLKGNFAVRIRARVSAVVASTVNLRAELIDSDGTSLVEVDLSDEISTIYTTPVVDIDNSDNYTIEQINIVGDDETHAGYILYIDSCDIINIDEMVLPTNFYEMKEGVHHGTTRMTPISYQDTDFDSGLPTDYYIRRINGQDVIGLWPRTATGILEYAYSAKDTVFSDLLDSSGDIVSANLTVSPQVEEGYHEMIILKAGINLGRKRNPDWATDKIDYEEMRADLVSLKSKHRNDGVVAKPIDF